MFHLPAGLYNPFSN